MALPLIKTALVLKSIVWDIFGNKASMAFALLVLVPMMGTAVWKWNAWLDSRDEAVITAVMYEQEKVTNTILADQLHSQLALQDTDQKAFAELTQQKQALEALADETEELLYELSDKNDWAATRIDVASGRVLYEFLKAASDHSTLYGGCSGTPTGCAAARLRAALAEEINGSSGDRRGY